MKIAPWIALALAFGAVLVLAWTGLPGGASPADPAPGADALTGATTVLDGEDFVTLDAAAREIVIHCGTSMRPAAERIARYFQQRHNIAVRFNFGGSSELLAGIELGRIGDLYICHDPYADRIDEKGLLARAATVGYLEPVIIVPPGNPGAIAGLADLARPGLKVGLPDARFATAGRLIQQALGEMGIEPDVRANLRLETRGHNDMALALTSGHIDVGMAWNFIAFYYAGRLEQVPAGVAFPETRVTVCLLTSAQDVEAAELFMAMAQSPQGVAVFEEMGYRRSTPAHLGGHVHGEHCQH